MNSFCQRLLRLINSHEPRVSENLIFWFELKIWIINGGRLHAMENFFHCVKYLFKLGEWDKSLPHLVLILFRKAAKCIREECCRIELSHLFRDWKGDLTTKYESLILMQPFFSRSRDELRAWLCCFEDALKLTPSLEKILSCHHDQMITNQCAIRQ